MSYVDGFVIAVPTDKKEAYTQIAEEAATVFKKYGATRVVECWGEDVPQGKVTSFPMAVKCKEDETVVFSWIWWPSKEVQQEGMKKFMEDPICDPERHQEVFDGKRMIYGSFSVLLDQ